MGRSGEKSYLSDLAEEAIGLAIGLDIGLNMQHGWMLELGNLLRSFRVRTTFYSKSYIQMAERSFISRTPLCSHIYIIECS